MINTVLVERSGDLLVTNRLSETRLYSLRDSLVPVLLSKVASSGDVQLVDLSDSHLVVAAGDRKDIEIYDIRNVYSPVLVNRMENVYQRKI